MKAANLKPDHIYTHFLKTPLEPSPRRIQVYIGNLYDQAYQDYSVLYILDGQNIFEEDQSFTGFSWQVNQTLESLGPQIQPLLIVAIDNAGSKRMEEYGPWSGAESGEFAHVIGQGVEFGHWLVKDLIPFINLNYPTDPKPIHTAIAGSSMGAIMALYLGHCYPEIFGNMGIFSLASFFNSQALAEFLSRHPLKSQSKLTLHVGTQEGSDLKGQEKNLSLSKQYLTATMDYYYHLCQEGHPEQHIKLSIYQGHKHHEIYWAQQFSDFLDFIFAKEP